MDEIFGEENFTKCLHVGGEVTKTKQNRSIHCNNALLNLIDPLIHCT